MKKTIFLLLSFLLLTAVFTDTGDLGGPAVAVRDIWNDAEYLPAAAAFYPEGGEFILELGLWENKTNMLMTSEPANGDYKYTTEIENGIGIFQPLLKGRMRMGPMAFSLNFRSPMMNYLFGVTEKYEEKAGFNSEGGGSVGIKNGFPMDIGLKGGFAFSKMLGLGFNFNYMMQTMKPEANEYYKEGGVIDYDETIFMEVKSNELLFGFGVISHPTDNLVAGVSFQMFDYKNTHRFTGAKFWNGTEYENAPSDYYDNKNDFPHTKVDIGGFRLNSIIRYIANENLVAGLAVIYDSIQPEISSEAETLTFKIYDADGYILTVGPGIWYHNDAFEFAGDIILMMPSMNIKPLRYWDTEYPNTYNEEIILKGLIGIFRVGAKVHIGNFTFSAGFQKLAMNTDLEIKAYDNFDPANPVHTDTEKIGITDIPFISNLNAKFNIIFRLNETMGIKYGVHWGLPINENTPNMAKDLLPALLPVVPMVIGTPAITDPNKLVIHKIGFYLLF